MDNQIECIECGELYVPDYEEQALCEECDCNSAWRNSEYQNKNISDWNVDDHLAAWYDDMMEKQNIGGICVIDEATSQFTLRI